MMKTMLLAAGAALALMPAAASATILTFDVDTTRPNDVLAMPQAYGDRVTAATQGVFSYGVGAEGFTPNIVVDYAPVAANLTRWTTGYGDLVNVYENEDDGDTLLAFTLRADAGSTVSLFGFDLGGYFGDYVIPGLTIRDEQGNLLYSVSNYTVRGSGAFHSVFDFSGAPLTGNALTVAIDLTGLGGNSDNIGFDNVRFGQGAAVTPVPEPVTWGMMVAGFGMLGGTLRRRRGSTRRGSGIAFEG